MKKLYFIIGSQDLYGEEVLKIAQNNGNAIAKYIDDCVGDETEILPLPIVRNADEATEACVKVCCDKDCIGAIVWMHTFSPAKMWIRALKKLDKPLLHLHTQFNQKLPYSTIDMDFMNLNQSAHGDREFGFICTRLNIKREVVTGFYKDEDVIAKIRAFIDVARAIEYSQSLKVAMFGNNMRNVAVTDGDRVESEIKYGWNVNYYGIGDLCNLISQVTDTEIDEKMSEYLSKYELDTNQINSVQEQAKYEIALEKFISREKISAFTDTFEDLYGLNQLPGLSVQNIMSKGIGFGPEGDYKTSALSAVLYEMARHRGGATGFTEDYTYDLSYGGEAELAAHMLEVSPVFAKNKPKIQVHPLGIGGKNDPARLVFNGVCGDGIAVSMVDMGTHFRLICSEIELITPPEEMPNLPVARLMWKIKPDFKTGATAWIYAGGAHHAVVSTVLSVEDIVMFANLTDTELVIIDEKTELNAFREKLNGGIKK